MDKLMAPKNEKLLKFVLIVSIIINVLLFITSWRLLSDQAVREISLGSFACMLMPLTIINIFSTIAVWQENKIGLWGCLGTLSFFTIYAVSFGIALSGAAPFLLIFAIILGFGFIAGVAIARRRSR